MPEPGRRSPASTAAAAWPTTRSPARRSASPSRPSTRPGIVLLCLLAARLTPRTALRGLALAGALAIAGFLVANPYALLDPGAFRAGLAEQSQASSDGGGKLGLVGESGHLYYLATLTWGLGWLPAIAAAAGAVGLWLRDRRLALVLVPAPVVFLLFMGAQDRFFARWLLPIYPLLCLLAAWAAVETAARLRPGRAWAVAAVAALLCVQGLVFSIHNDVVLARDDTRALARAWMVENIPEGDRVVIEPIAPDQWAMDPGRPSSATGTGNRWNKWPTSRFRGEVVKLEDFERTLRTEPARPLRTRRLLPRRHGLDPVRPRAHRARGGAAGDPLLRRAQAPRRHRLPRQPARRRARQPLLVRLLVQQLSARLRAPGPEIVIYRLRDC